jgi:paraquat-inducible protein B
MKTKVSPTVVGFFVLGAMLLGMVGLFSFGSLNFLRKPQRFMVYFDESVSGLDGGSPVKLRGVRVGRVSQVSLSYDKDTNRSVVAVLCELNRDVLSDPAGTVIDVADRAEIENLIQGGLRAQLGVVGLATGLLYVELDFKDPEEYPIPHRKLVSIDYAVVPAVPSTISEFQASFGQILSNIKDIDFATIATQLNGLLADTRRQINAVDIATLSQEWTKTAQSFQSLAASPEISATFANLNTAITDLSRTLKTVDGAVGPTTEDLSATLAKVRESLEAFNSMAANTSQFISTQSGLGAEAAEALRQLGDASAAIARLADFLERNPSALISGRSSQP